jgi:hypothetical protein
MREVHEVLGIAVLAANGFAAAWGFVAWRRGSPSVVFWPILRVAQAVTVVTVLTGLVRTAGHHKPPDGLHYVYGVAPLVVAVVAEAMRIGAAQQELEGVDDPDALTRPEQLSLARRVVIREMAIMSIASVLVVTLALRAAQSGGLF